MCLVNLENSVFGFLSILNKNHDVQPQRCLSACGDVQLILAFVLSIPKADFLMMLVVWKCCLSCKIIALANFCFFLKL